MIKKTAFLILMALLIASCNAPFAGTLKRGSLAQATLTPLATLVPTIAITISPTATPRQSPTTAPVNVGMAPRQHEDSIAASISGNGRYVVYQSSAGDLIDQDLPICPLATQATASQPCQQIYLYDRQTRHTELVSASPKGAPGNGASGAAKLSADGRFVVFSSYASNLATTATGGVTSPGLLVTDRQTHTTTQIAQDAANPDISADGRYIVYEKGASTGISNIYLYNRVTGLETQISTPDPAATGDNLGPPGSSFTPSISADGDWIAFWSWDGHLVQGDSKLCGSSNCGDVFLYNRIQQIMTRIPMDAPWGLGMEFFPTSLSADGRWLVTSNLLYDQTNGQITHMQLRGGKISADGFWLLAARGPQVFVQPVDQQKIEQVSVSSQGTPADGPLITSLSCMGPPQCQFKTSFDFSADGSLVVFDSTADNLAGADPYLCTPPGLFPHNCADIFLRDRQSKQTIWVSKPVRPAPAAVLPPPTGTAKPLTSLERSAEITSTQANGAANPTRTEQVWYLQPGFWRFDTRSTPPAPREPDILAGDGTTIWHYNPGNNTETIFNGPIQSSPLDQGPALFGSAEKINSLQDYFTRIKTCYPQPTFLGAGDAIAGRSTYLIYLGRATCANSRVHGAGPEVLWLDQQTLVALRWVAQSPNTIQPLYALTVQEVQFNPNLTPDRFNKITIPGAMVIDQRK